MGALKSFALASITTVAVAAFGAPLAQASEHGVFVRVVMGSLDAVHWAKTEFPVKQFNRGDDAVPIAHLEGRLPSAGWGLMKDAKWLVKPGTTGPNFAFDVEAGEEPVEMRLSALDEKGNLQEALVHIDFPEWKAWHERHLPPGPLSEAVSGDALERFESGHVFFTANAGAAYASYTDASGARFAMGALRGSLEAPLWLVPARVSFESGVGATGVAFTSTDPSHVVTEIDAYLRLGYLLPIPLNSWRFKIQLDVPLWGLLETPYAFPEFEDNEDVGLGGRLCIEKNFGYANALAFYGASDVGVLKSIGDDLGYSLGLEWTHRFPSGIFIPVRAELSYLSFSSGSSWLSTALTVGFGF